MNGRKAFTLVELLVALAVLAILVLTMGQLISRASSIALLGNKRIDSDSQAHPVLDRMAVDFAQMVRRPDVDSYVKGLDPETGNDRIAFFSNVPGYYPSTGSPSPASLVSYRVNGDQTSPSFNRLERLGKGLLWNGVSSTYKPIIFGSSGTLIANWPYVADNTKPDPDSDYETIGPQIFRFEYFYVLKTGVLANTPGAPGMQDVAAICVAIAAIDPKSKVLLSDAQIGTLIGRLKDFDGTKPSYDLVTSWQSSLDGTTDMPRSAIASIRIYWRYLAFFR